MAYRWGSVGLDGYGSIPAYIPEHEYWNGFLLPYFRAEDVPSINEVLSEFGEDTIEYEPDEDAFVCRSRDGNEYFWGEDVDGMHLYPIGRCWIWSEVE